MKYTLLSCMLIITHVCISMDDSQANDGVRRRSRTRSDQERRSHDIALATLVRNNGDKRRSLPENYEAFNKYGSFVFDTDEITTGKNIQQSTSEPALPTHPTNTNQ